MSKSKLRNNEPENWILRGDKHNNIEKDRAVYEEIRNELNTTNLAKTKKKRVSFELITETTPKLSAINPHTATPHPIVDNEVSTTATGISKSQRLFDNVTTSKNVQNDRNEKVIPSDETKDLWWTAALFIFISHLVIIYMVLFRHEVSTSIFWYAIWQAWLQLLGITAGYHRLWSHNAFSANLGVRIFLAIVGLQSFQGSI
jgi:hypothetical protein